MTHFFMRCCFWLLAIIAAPSWAQVGALTKPQTDALQPLYCGRCLELREMSVWRVAINSRTGPYDATVADVVQGSNWLMTKPETLVKDSHVCLGTRYAAKVGVWTSPIAANQKSLTQHPANFETVCAGDLVRIDAFLQSVVAGIFDAKLATFEALLSSDSLQKVVEANLAPAMASQRASIAESVRRDVLADLNKSPTPSSQLAPGAVGSELRICNVTSGCTAGASPTEACCECRYQETGSQLLKLFKGECVLTSQGWTVRPRLVGQPK